MPVKLEAPRTGRKPKYPWARWTDGKIHVVRQGRQFKVDPINFRASLRWHARVYGFGVTVVIEGKAVRFQFTKNGKHK